MDASVTAKTGTLSTMEIPADLPEPKLSDNALEVLKKRYLRKDADGKTVVETPKGLFWRVAWNIAQADRNYGADDEKVMEVARKFYEMMAKQLFLPNTPCLVNAGHPLQMLSACHVLPVEDSIEGIYQTLKDQALIMKGGGGVGYSFSRIRPKNDVVKSTSGIASGPISFMQIFDKSTEIVKQGGVRRGASMSILRVDHPDILEFIDMKMHRSVDEVQLDDGSWISVSSAQKRQLDIKNLQRRTVPGAMENFNVSVAITDKFIEAFDKGTEYNLIHPKTKNVVGKLNARVVMDKIAKNAWKSGEPGLFFIDEANRTNPVPHVGEIEATNPCQPSWATIATPDGIRMMEDISVGSTIWSGRRWTKVTNKTCTGKKPVFSYTTRAGVFYGTDSHRIVCHGEKIEVKHAEAIDTSQCWTGDSGLHSATATLNPQDIIDGLILGDGTVHKASHNLPPLLVIGKDDIDYLGSEISHLLVESRFGIHEGWWAVHTTMSRDEVPLTFLRKVPDRFKYGAPSVVRGFLRGLYSANGSVVGSKAGNSRVTLKASSFSVISDVQQMLSFLGIKSYYTVNKSHDNQFSNGIYRVKESYDLNISTDISLFQKLIGFIQKYKQEKVIAIVENRETNGRAKTTFEIIEINYLGDEDVYDITVDDTDHTYWTGGLLVSNCGEIDLLPWDLCNLGSIAINRFVKRKLSPHSSFDSIMAAIDWNCLRDAAHSAVHFLDNMIDMNEPPLPQITEMAKGNRRTGLGVMGHAYMLYYLGIPYDSERGLEVTQSVMEFIQDAAVEASEKLGQDRGFYLHWKDGCPRRRNSYVTAIAPTGSISMIADTSGGCEPEFSLIWYKNVMDGTHLPYISEYFMEVAKREGFYDEKLKDDILSSVSDTGQPKHPGSCRGISRVPKIWQEVFAVSSDVAPEYHVRMQAAFQKHVHSAVSKTINMPKTATVEDVKKAYLLAHELKCKGITVYVDGSREHQVLNIGESTKKTESGKEAPKIVNPVATKIGSSNAVTTTAKPTRRERPSSVSGTTQRVETGFGTLYVTVNEDDHGIIEVFATLGKTGGYTASFVEAIGRLASLLFASGMPLDAVVKQLAGIRSPKIAYDQKEKILSVPDAMAIALRRHLEQKVSKNKEKDKKESGKSYGGNGTSSANGTALTTNSTNHSTFSDSEMAILQRIIEQPKDTHDEARQVIDKNGSPECSDCGGELTFSESCIKCLNCGYSEC